MESIVAQLINLQRQYGAFLGGVFGGLIGVLVAGSQWISDEADLFRQKFNSLKDRVKTLEDKTAASASSAGLTAGESQTLTAASITGVVANLAVALFTYTANDLNRVGYHQIRQTASGAVATGTVASVRWGTALSSTRAPEITVSYHNNTSAAAAKLAGVIPTFNSTNQCTGYDIDSPIALAATDVIDMGIRVREIAA